MRRFKLACLLFIILSPITNSFSGVNFEEMTLEEAIKKAKQNGKSIMIDYYTDWCVPCKELDKHIFQDTTISRFINEKFVSLKINAEKEDGIKLGKKYQLPQAYPTVLFLDSEGKEVDRIVGLFGKEDYFKTIQDYAAGKNTFPVLLSQVQKEKDNPSLNFKIGKKYAERGLWKKATEYYEKALSDDLYAHDAFLWYRVGALYSRFGEIQKARKAVTKALALDPGNEQFKSFLDAISFETK